jgi:uncharacterized protein
MIGTTRRHRLSILTIGLLLTWLGGAVGRAKEVPYLTGRVNDYAEMINEAGEERIDSRLRSFEEATGAQVAVLTIESLDGDPLEDFSLRVVETWELGRKGVDDGVLLLVARDDRKMRIEVGYGLEGRLTLEGEEVIPEEAPTPIEINVPERFARFGMFLFFLFMVGIFAFTALFSEGCSSWFLYLFLTPFFFAFPAALLRPAAGLWFGFGWLILFPLFKLWMSKSTSGRRFVKRHPKWTSFPTSGGWGGGSGGGGFSGGGFSGGGGSFGGGGASSSW